MAPYNFEDDSGIAGVSTPTIVGIIAGSLVFVGASLLAAYAFIKRRYSNGRDPNAKQFLLPNNVRPVISFKTAAGPGGLKKSPSPVQSPENGDLLLQDGLYNSQSSREWVSPGSGEQEGSGLVMEAIGSETTLCLLDDSPESNDVPAAELSFKMGFNFDKNALTITIVGASNLQPLPKGDDDTGPVPGVDGATLLDPYVKLQLLPEKQHRVKTRVVRNTLNPVYEEEFTIYGISYNQLQSTTLHFAIISFDRYSRDEVVGEVLFPLKDISFNQETGEELEFNAAIITKTMKLQNTENRGELLLSVCHQPDANRLSVVVLKARNLPKFDVTGLADPYVKVCLLYRGERVAKKKSHVKKRTLAPVYNETFSFDLPSSEAGIMEKIGLEFTIMDWDRLTKNEVIGRCELGSKVDSKVGRSHWQEVCECPRKQLANWHPLKVEPSTTGN